MEPCPCDAFMSHPYGNWSACILPESKRDPQRGGLWGQGADKECGEGVRFRAIACSDKNGRPVDPSFCNSSGKESREKSQMRTLTQLRRFVPGPEIAVDSFFKKGFYSYLPTAHCHHESKACKMHNTPCPSTVIWTTPTAGTGPRQSFLNWSRLIDLDLLVTCFLLVSNVVLQWESTNPREMTAYFMCLFMYLCFHHIHEEKLPLEFLLR